MKGAALFAVVMQLVACSSGSDMEAERDATAVSVDLAGVDSGPIENPDALGPVDAGVAHPTGNTYYVSTSGTGSGNGQTVNTPWTLAQLTMSLAQIQAGDAVLFKRGDTFANVAIHFTASGTSAAPIFINAYDNGNNPILDGGGSAASPILHLDGVSFVQVNNLVIQNSNYFEGALYVTGSHDIGVHNNFFNTAIRCLSCMGSTGNLDFSYNYFTAFSDTVTNGDLTNGGGNAIQLNNCSGAGIVIDYNKLYTAVGAGANPTPGVGDQISLFESNGTAGSPIKVYFNEIRGGSSNLHGYTGIGVGDTSGSYQDVEYNLIVTSGITGITIAGGNTITVNHNTIYGAKTAYNTYEGLGYGDFGGTTSDVTISDNSVNWTLPSGNKLDYYFFPNVTPITSGNISDSALVNDTIVPNPTWTGTPWNLNP